MLKVLKPELAARAEKSRLPTGRMARAELLVLAMILMAFQGLAAQVSQEGGADRLEIDGPPAPVGGAMINQAGQDGATLRAVRVTEPLEIDGVLDEPFYRSLPPITEFVQALPEEDGEPSEFTEVWIGFDDNNVYVSAKIWDTAGPDGWVANEMRRDSQHLRTNDRFRVYLDTFHDRRNAVGFAGNAIGGFSDTQITNEGNPNSDWNPIWETRSSLFDGGWSIEMAIPFKSLRYRPGREQMWGIQMTRSVVRRNEQNFIRALPLSVAGGGGGIGGLSGLDVRDTRGDRGAAPES